MFNVMNKVNMNYYRLDFSSWIQKKMASATPTSSKSSTRIQWMWNASPDPFSKSQPVEWKLYSDAENMIIEEEFQTGQKFVILDNYSIDFKHNIQILDSDCNKQRPVRRKICNRDDHRLREERFTSTSINPKRPFSGLYRWISPFIKEVVKDLNITSRQLPSKDASIVPMVVEKAALGIIEEGKKIGKQREAEHIATKLRQKKDAGIKEVWECCAHLYSLESFLCKNLNETMRLIGSAEHDQDWRSKVRTLGPFCLLLWDNPFSYETTEKGRILYRGAELSDKQVSAFEDECLKEDKPIRSCPPLTSCSPNQAKAEVFGNVLFIMAVKYAFTMDLQPSAVYPDEEEELLSPGICFTVDRVEKVKNKHLIYLKHVQQYRREYTHISLS